jgi:hypothetical protein
MIPASQRQAALSVMKAADAASFIGKINVRSSRACMAAIFADAISATDHLDLLELSALNGLCNRKADFYESAI